MDYCHTFIIMSHHVTPFDFIRLVQDDGEKTTSPCALSQTV